MASLLTLSLSPAPAYRWAGGKGRVREPLVKKLNAFALVFRYVSNRFAKTIDTDMGLCG